MKGGEPKVFAFSWSFRIPAEFLELLEARRPFALVATPGQEFPQSPAESYSPNRPSTMNP
jgi:hypothetical protein